MATMDKPNNKNLKALFSVICLCIVALGLIVYFSTQSSKTTDVNEATTVTETTVKKHVATTAAESTAAQSAQKTTQTKTTKKSSAGKSAKTTTEIPSMSAGDTNVPYKSFYKYPCDETTLAGFSQELVENKTMGDYRAHTAVDFKAAAGAKIVAVNDGLVRSVKKDALLGTVVEIDHGGKLVARYCGMDTVTVGAGDYVTIGQNIGTLGSVPFEASEENHLHFETLLDGKYVNPLDVMGKTE